MTDTVPGTLVGEAGAVRLVAPHAPWPPLALTPPEVAGAGGAELTSFRAFRSEDGAPATLVAGCVATPIPGWVEDMRGPVAARADAFAAKVAERVVGVPIELRGVGDGPRAAHVVASSAPAVGSARALVAFDVDTTVARVVTCGVACVVPREADVGGRGAATGLACDAAVRDARIEGSSPPPPPGRALATATWAVHHPSTVLGISAVVVAFGLLAAVVTRRRPRSRL